MFSAEHKDCREWAFQFAAHMRLANPGATAALRLEAMQETAIMAQHVRDGAFEAHNPHLYMALALICEGGALLTVKITEVNDEMEA